jgi:hypothetical protein
MRRYNEGKRFHLGHFNSEEAAGLAYNAVGHVDPP